MPATTKRPPTSAARIAANRKNALLSTGPRTEAGKAIARANAVKHGLTGAGVALPREDAAAIEQRFAAIRDELMPQTVLGTFLAHQVALATVRCQRSVRHESALLTARVEEAEADFDQTRIDQAKQIYRILYQNPSQHYRTLISTPEGVDCVVGGLQKFIGDLLNPKYTWSLNHGTQLAMLFDVGMQDLVQALSQAMLGNPALIQPKAMAHLTTDPERRAWARTQTVGALRDAIDDLTAHRATLDHAAIARARALVADRAAFDATSEATLARRYEAASTRDLYRALREFHAVETHFAPEPAPESTPEPATAAGPKPSEEKTLGQPLASFSTPEPVVALPTPPADPVPTSPPIAPRMAAIPPDLRSIHPGAELAFTIGRP